MNVKLSLLSIRTGLEEIKILMKSVSVLFLIVLVFVSFSVIGIGSIFSDSAVAATGTTPSGSAQINNGPVIQADLQEIAWKSYADYSARTLSVTYLINNVGNEPALDCIIISSGASNNVQTLTQLPTNMGSIDSGGMRMETIKYLVPLDIARFKVVNTISYMDILQRQHFFPQIPSGPSPYSINVRDYGATGDGITDDTGAIQAAISALPTPGVLYVPPGEYLVGNLVGHSDMTVRGEGNTSILKAKVSTSGTYYRMLKFWGSGPDEADNLRNITIENIQLRGQSDVGAMIENQSLVNLMGVTNVTINNVLFKGMQGDGIYLGGAASGPTPRHNYNVNITGSTFDGINKNNRKGIGVKDIDGLVVTNSLFTHLTIAGQPGPIDLEAGYNFQVFKNVLIDNNVFDDNCEPASDSQIQISTSSVASMNEPPSNISVTNNQFINSDSEQAIYFASAETNPAKFATGIVISGNLISMTTLPGASGEYYVIRISRGYNGVDISNNTITNGGTVMVGAIDVAATTVSNVRIKDNVFSKNGIAKYGINYGNLAIGSVDDLEIDGNTFENPAGGQPVFGGIIFACYDGIGSSNRVKVTNNTFIKGALQTYSIRLINHTLATSTNIYYGNNFVGGSLINQFTASQTQP